MQVYNKKSKQRTKQRTNQKQKQKQKDTHHSTQINYLFLFLLLCSQVKVTSKLSATRITAGMVLPYVQSLVNKAVSLVREREPVIEVLCQNADKISSGMWEEGREENRKGGERREEEIGKGR